MRAVPRISGYRHHMSYEGGSPPRIHLQLTVPRSDCARLVRALLFSGRRLTMARLGTRCAA